MTQPTPKISGAGRPIYMNIEHPFREDQEGTIPKRVQDQGYDYRRALLNIEYTDDGFTTWTQIAFLDGHVIAFYERPPSMRGCWVIRGGMTLIPDGYTDFIQMLGQPSDTVDDVVFWRRFLTLMSRPEVLLDIAARQAAESLKGLK